MVELLKPIMGGFLRPFGCGWFIREFLMGHGPEGRPKIGLNRGACQADVFYHYKLALHTAYAEDATAWENDRRIKAGLEPYTELEYAERVDGTCVVSPTSWSSAATTASSCISTC